MLLLQSLYMNDLKLGFIGCGGHAQLCLYPSLAALGIRLQSVCALHLEHAQEIAIKYDIPHVYDNYKTMLQKENLDAVFIAVSGEQHVQIVLDCLKAHVHVFVEKPVGSTVDDAVRVADMAKKVGKHVQVGYMKRFSPIYQKARLMVNDHKTFGAPVSFNAIFNYGIFWICYKRTQFFLNAAIHNIDLLRYFVGEITDIHCVKKLVADGISYQFNFASDQKIIGSMVIMGLLPWAHRKEEMTITGTKAFVIISESNTITFHLTSGTNKVSRWQVTDKIKNRFSSVDSTSSGNLQLFYLSGYIDELKEFVESVKNNKATINTAEENIKTMKLYEKILPSLEKIS